MNKRLQNNRRLHRLEGACNHNHAAAHPPPRDRGRWGGSGAVGGKLWASRAGRVGRGGREPTGTEGQSRRGCPERDRPAPCPIQPPAAPQGSRSGEAVAGTWARCCLLHPLLTVQVGCPAKEKVSQEAAGAARPHHRGTVPLMLGCSCRAMPPTSRLCQDPPKGLLRPQKGLCGPFLARAARPRERQSVPPSGGRSPCPRLAHGPGGGKGGGRTNPNQLKTEPGTRRLGSTNQLVALWICGQRV